jgi:GT2 family glycosyltransferase
MGNPQNSFGVLRIAYHLTMVSKFTRQNINISIIIPNWNGIKYLPRCLEAIEEQTFRDFEVIVVDNGSADGSVPYIKNNYPDVTVVELGENHGFAQAANIGARKAGGRWLALLNNDAFPAQDWLQNLRRAAEQHPDYSFFASRLLQADNPQILDGAGDVYHISGMAWRRYYNLPNSRVDHQQQEVFSPCGAAALYDRGAYLEVGGYDPTYTSYHEDVDLGFRLRLRGYRCLYVPDAVVYHIGSASFGVQSDTQIYFGHRNLVWSFFQNMPGGLLWKYLPAHIAANALFLGYYTLRGHAGAIWRAKRDAVLKLPDIIKKRQMIQSKRTATPDEISAVLEHDWLGPYLLGLKARAKTR